MRRLPLLGALGLVLSVGAVPASAGTTTVSLAGGGFRVHVTNESTFFENEGNSILVEEDAAGNLLVTDSGQGAMVLAGSGCSQQTSTRVSCPPDPNVTANLEVATGVGNDSVAITLPARPKSGVATTNVFGGPGVDRIIGGPAAETLDGDGRLGNGQVFTPDPTGGPQEGNDVLAGGGGPDTLLGRGGRDYLNGSAFGQADTAANTLDGGGGADYFDVGGMLGADRMTGGSGGDAPLSTDGGTGGLLAVGTLQNGERAQIFGGDTVSYGTRTYATSGTAGVVADLDGVRDDGAVGENDRIDADVEALVGTIRDDRLIGSAVANRIEGKLGTDTLAGGDGADRMRFRDGVPDRCYVPGTGDNVDLDLSDPPATLCTPKSLPLSFSTTLDASPVDETMPYMVIRKRVRRKGARRMVARVTCPRSASRSCKGRLSLSRGLGRKALARRSFQARPGRTARVTFRLRRGRVAAFKRAGRVLLTSVTQGTSKIGPTTTIVARRF
jgi:hypothetical protein